MSAFVKFLVSLIAHLVWQRVGGKGGIPPVRLPRSKKPVIIPAVSTWQLMVAMWVMKKFWTQYGDKVKTRLTDTPHPIPRRIGSWLPDVDTKAAPDTAVGSMAAVPAPSGVPPALASQTPASTRHYHTQPLDSDTDDSAAHAANLGRGSLLSALQRKPSGSTG